MGFSDSLTVCEFIYLLLGGQIQECCPKLVGIRSLQNREIRVPNTLLYGTAIKT